MWDKRGWVRKKGHDGSRRAEKSGRKWRKRYSEGREDENIAGALSSTEDAYWCIGDDTAT